MARPELNLLNYEIERRPSGNLELIIGVTVLVLLALIMLAIWGTAVRHDQKQRQEIEYLQKLQSKLPDAHHLESAQNKVLQKKMAIDKLQRSRQTWSKVLIEMEKATVESVAVDNITAANDTIVIRGTVPDFPILLKLTESLTNNRCFKKVRVKKAEKIEGQVNFEIWMLIRR